MPKRQILLQPAFVKLKYYLTTLFSASRIHKSSVVNSQIIDSTKVNSLFLLTGRVKRHRVFRLLTRRRLTVLYTTQRH